MGFWASVSRLQIAVVTEPCAEHSWPGLEPVLKGFQNSYLGMPLTEHSSEGTLSLKKREPLTRPFHRHCGEDTSPSETVLIPPFLRFPSLHPCLILNPVVLIFNPGLGMEC